MLFIMAFVGGLTFQIFINIGMALGISPVHRRPLTLDERRPRLIDRHLHRHRLRDQRAVAPVRELRCAPGRFTPKPDLD
jgi:hypothetical protein